MVKIGKGFVALEAVEAVAPAIDGKGYMFFLSGGCAVEAASVTEEELTEVLTREGYLEPPACEGVAVSLSACFTDDELKELVEVWGHGYRYIAKEASGQAYAYELEPRKGQVSWLNDDLISDVSRLVAGPYAALSFDDIAPLHIGVILEEMVQ